MKKRQNSKKRRPWSTEEDNNLKHYKTLFPNLSWKGLIQKAKLARNVKSVSHRWENYVKFDFNRAKFSEEENHIINCVMALSPDRPWKFLAEFCLPGRSKNDIKNQWNNCLKKRQATTSDPDRQAELEACLGSFNLITKVDPESPDEETSNHSVGGDDLEALTSGCSHRRHNFLKSDFKGGEFSPEEDERIILKRRGVSWASMAKDRLLEQRSTNAIKNLRNNHLKKTPEGIMILRLIDLMDDEASDQSVPEDDLKALMAEFQSIIQGDDLEASTSGSADLIPNYDPNALHSIMETYTR